MKGDTVENFQKGDKSFQKGDRELSEMKQRAFRKEIGKKDRESNTLMRILEEGSGRERGLYKKRDTHGIR